MARQARARGRGRATLRVRGRGRVTVRVRGRGAQYPSPYQAWRMEYEFEKECINQMAK